MQSTSPALAQADQCSCGVERKPGSLAEEPTVREALLRMVIGMEGNRQAQENLFQEAWVYFWSREQQRPGQPPSWYLQGVKFFLQNLRTSGRSVDSPKRRGAQALFADRGPELGHWRDSFEFDDGIMSEVNAHDIFCLLVNRLEPTDQTILGALFEGAGICDIARTLHVPRGFVERHRLKIARLAVERGINPAPAGSARRR